MATFRCVVNGSVPVTLCFLILRTTRVTTALSGSEDVLKCRMERYCRFLALSPRANVAAVGLIVLPMLLVSVDSSTQPSRAAPDLNCVTIGARMTIALFAPSELAAPG